MAYLGRLALKRPLVYDLGRLALEQCLVADLGRLSELVDFGIGPGDPLVTNMSGLVSESPCWLIWSDVHHDF